MGISYTSVRIPILLVMLVFLLSQSCNKSQNNSNPQGPKDPSFEIGSSWVLDATQVSTAGSSIMTGTGFMPTKGLCYLDVNVTDSRGVGIAYQDGVDFSKSTKMIFDYSLNGLPGTTASILFTINGTQTLWTATGTTGVQKLNDTIYLPSLPDAGRLTIQLSGNSIGYGDFLVDNIRVQ